MLLSETGKEFGDNIQELGAVSVLKMLLGIQVPNFCASRVSETKSSTADQLFASSVTEHPDHP